jgi:hypothetical protein
MEDLDPHDLKTKNLRVFSLLISQMAMISAVLQKNKSNLRFAIGLSEYIKGIYSFPNGRRTVTVLRNSAYVSTSEYLY